METEDGRYQRQNDRSCLSRIGKIRVPDCLNDIPEPGMKRKECVSRHQLSVFVDHAMETHSNGGAALRNSYIAMGMTLNSLRF